MKIRPIALSRVRLVINDRRKDRPTDKAAYGVACTTKKVYERHVLLFNNDPTFDIQVSCIRLR